MVDKSAEACTRCHQAGSPLERLAMKERTRVFRAGSGEPRMLGVINPIYNQPSCWTAACHVHSRAQTVLGVLDVTLPLALVERDILRGQAGIVVFSVTATAALAVIVAAVFRRWVDEPVEELLEATRRVAGGDLAYRIQPRSDDELGELARSFDDMTRRLSEARLQLFQSDKLASLGRLAAGVAHEINNPLTGVLTYASFLVKRTADRPELQEDLKVIVRETIRSREIVKSLLDFSRQSVPRKAEADLNAIIARAAGSVENQFAAAHVRLALDLAEGLPRAAVDSNQMQQVFINLFVNAADAMAPKGGTVAVSSAARTLSPVGTMPIKAALCPKRHSLLDPEVKVGGKPSIRVKVRANGSEGLAYLDPVYGKAGHRHAGSLESAAPALFSCPECSLSLMKEGASCPACGAGVYTFESPPKGMVEGCARKGCLWQRWEAVDGSGQTEFIEVRVSDTGSGIPKENLDRIFEPFFTTKGQKGNGLGLAVIWGIVDNHNGTISVESEVGSGTSFLVRIPVKV
ncbi:MAG: HAMP domain-containing protein [Elusimicrobia bacterium]|nr:HAMP domain-containing protein [Elusimicrobiota bacterium]